MKEEIKRRYKKKKKKVRRDSLLTLCRDCCDQTRTCGESNRSMLFFFFFFSTLRNCRKIDRSRIPIDSPRERGGDPETPKSHSFLLADLHEAPLREAPLRDPVNCPLSGSKRAGGLERCARIEVVDEHPRVRRQRRTRTADQRRKSERARGDILKKF